MGISMTVYPISDDEIEALTNAPSQLSPWLRLQKESAKVFDAWDLLDFILGGSSILVVGDVYFHSSGTTHAVRSGRTREAGGSFAALTADAFRERADPAKMKAAGLWMNESPSGLWTYFTGLRDLVERAAARGQGLLFDRDEDY
jgi:hypothetical protein